MLTIDRKKGLDDWISLWDEEKKMRCKKKNYKNKTKKKKKSGEDRQRDSHWNCVNSREHFIFFIFLYKFFFVSERESWRLSARKFDSIVKFHWILPSRLSIDLKIFGWTFFFFFHSPNSLFSLLPFFLTKFFLYQ